MIRPATSALRAIANPSSSFRPAAPIVSRALHASASASFATPSHGVPSGGKAPAMKEFKIYRWVRADRTRPSCSRHNLPDRPRPLVSCGIECDGS